jgi:HAE1 family hydrophobic/amphiphilic exporter-1
MRVWINPAQLASMDLTVSEIVRAIQAQNVISPGGKVGGEPAPPGTQFTYPLRLQGRLESAQDFQNVIVKANSDGSFVRVKDVGRVELGAQNYNAIGRYNGQSAAVLAIYQTPGTNALAVADQIRATMTRLKEAFPEDLGYEVSLDTTKAVTAGINGIVHTLFEAIVLVILVVFIFLQSFRATLVPILTVPVSLIGTFAIFPMLGFVLILSPSLGLCWQSELSLTMQSWWLEAVMHHMNVV